jgi:predicted RNA methylase
MKLKHLQSALSSVPHPQFVQPNITLEQYATSPELTSYIIFSALSKQDIGYGKTVLDLGCGTGMLSIGSALVGSSHILLVDCDENAMNVARENMEAMGIGDWDGDIQQKKDDDDVDDEHDDDEEDDSCCFCCRVEYILAQVKHDVSSSTSKSGGGGHTRGGGRRGDKRRGGRGGGGGRNTNSKGSSSRGHRTSRTLESPRNIGPLDDGIPLPSGCVDTVITNPPFGTKPGNAGIDVTFLRSAIRLARRAVYSFHKTSTREYLIKTVEGWGYEVSVVAEMKFDIPKMYKFHAKDNVDVFVDLIRVEIAGETKDEIDT